jgi:hypothetical protein
MYRRKHITIERTWSGMVGGWFWRADYVADRLLDLLDQLGQALSDRNASEAKVAETDHQIANEVFERWNKTLIRHGERDQMLDELNLA